MKLVAPNPCNPVIGLEYHLGRDLRPHPKNPRRHPDGQIKALAGVLDQVGIAGACLAFRAEDGVITLIDGHCRGENWQDTEWPVLLLDVSEQEAEVVLASHDPLGAMASIDDEAMARLLETAEIECTELLEALKPEEMPDFEPEPDDSNQGRLDEKAPVTCPECGCVFPPS